MSLSTTALGAIRRVRFALLVASSLGVEMLPLDASAMSCNNSWKFVRDSASTYCEACNALPDGGVNMRCGWVYNCEDGRPICGGCIAACWHNEHCQSPLGEPCPYSVCDPGSGADAGCSNGAGECERLGTWECQVEHYPDGGSWYVKRCNAPVPGAPTPELCDGKDNDCDGTVDDGCDNPLPDGGAPPPPRCTGPSCKCTPGSGAPLGGGDPFTLAHGNSYYRIADVSLASSVGQLELARFYVSHDDVWYRDGSLQGVPAPFGASPSLTQSARWWHNLFSFVYIDDNTWKWRGEGGHLARFEACALPGCFAQPEFSNASEPARLQKTSAGYTVYADDGRVLRYEAGWAGSGSVATHFFLTQIEKEGVGPLATLTYAQPDATNCPTTPYGSNPYVPFLRYLDSADGKRMELHYERLLRPDGTGECVIRSIDLHDRGGETPFDAGTNLLRAVTYAYTVDSAERPGLLLEAATLASTQRYSYAPTSLSLSVAGTTTTTHDYSAEGRVLSDTGSDHQLSVSWGPWGMSCPPGSSCCGQLLNRMTMVDNAAGRGDGTAGSAGMTREVDTLPNMGQHLAPRTFQLAESCGYDGGCSPGSERWEWSCSSDGGAGYERAHKNKREAWEVTTRYPDAGFEVEKVQRGAQDMNGTGALEETRYTYSTGPSGRRLVGEERDSLLGGAGTVTTTSYQPNGTTIRSGYTKDISGVSAQKHLGTFYFTSSCGSAADPLGRVREVHGPCFVSNPGATDCDLPGGYPVTQYEYWSDSPLDNRRNQLHYVRRFPAGGACSGGFALVRSHEQYDAHGHPTQVIDEAGSSIAYTYQGDQLTSKTVGGRTTSYGYDNGELAWVRYPEGNYEVFCHRGTPGLAACTGTWTARLLWKAKSGSQTGETWSEKVVYSYWPDGTVSEERYRDGCPAGCTDASGEERRVRKFAADAHRRPTWEAWGSNAQYQAVRRFDGADNLNGVGLPYNNPPSFCANDSTRCALMEHDATDRLQKVTEYAASPGAAIDTRLAYDAHGNVCAVTVNAAPDWSLVGPCQVTSSSGNDSRTAYYVYDDFGNVVEVRLPGSKTNTGGRGATRHEYDARGNVVKKQTEQMRLNGETLAYNHDLLGRQTAVSRVTGFGSETLLAFGYDYDGWPGVSCPQPSYTGGRLRVATDAIGSTWFSYDAEGRVVAELRPSGTDCNGPTPDRHLFYSYTPNGNLAQLIYPHGRTVSYGYTGDRVSSVSAMSWNGVSWSSQSLLSNVQWEPYGDLRGYGLTFPNFGTPAGLEYLLGDDGSLAPSADCPAEPPSQASSDKTGRLRSLRLSSGPYVPGTGNGDIYNRTYTWKADQVARTDTCVLGAGSQKEDYGYAGTAGLVGYDQLLRLVSLDSPSFPVTGGAQSRVEYSYDGRGNRVARAVGQAGTMEYSYASGVGQADWLLSSQRSMAGTMLLETFSHDLDGRVSGKQGAVDSSGGPGRWLSFTYGPDGAQSAHESVFKAVYVNGAVYNYFYDAFGRRRKKVYPTGAEDEFYYTLSKELLEDVGSNGAGGFSPRPIDEYIWLAGRPVAVFRSAFQQGSRLPDFTGDCMRNGESAACDLYYLVTDHLGKPVLMLDSRRRVVGTGEYEPFGQVNRVQLWGESAHPYASPTPETTLASFTQAGLGQLLAQARVRFPLVDTEGCLYPGNDTIKFKDGAGAVLEQVYGYHRGEVWTGWGPAVNGPLSGSITFSADGQNWQPDFAGCSSCCAPWSYSGVVVAEYEYRRYQSGATPYWTRLRFPGQYHDPETDLFENWNRYYDPSIGRYLQPEPMLQSPGYVKSTALAGHSVPAYAYAENNPVHFTDPTGLWTIEVQCGFVDVPWGRASSGDSRPFPSCAECEAQRAKAAELCTSGSFGLCSCAQRLANAVCAAASASGGCKAPPPFPLPPPPKPPAPVPNSCDRNGP